MRRAVIVVMSALIAVSLAAAQEEGNPLERERGRPAPSSGWSGAFVDGALVDRTGAREYEVEGRVVGDALEGTLCRDDARHAFTGRLEGAGLVVTSGQTTTRWRRGPSSSRAAALADLREARLEANESAAVATLKR